MTTVALTNVIPDNPTRRGTDRGPDVYLFYDPALAHKYDRLVPPDRDLQRLQPRFSRSFDRGLLTLRNSWVTTTFCEFLADASRGQVNRWPFSTTTVIERSVNGFPTDDGHLDVDDLGDEVVSILRPLSNDDDRSSSTTSAPADGLTAAAAGVPTDVPTDVPTGVAASPSRAASASSRPATPDRTGSDAANNVVNSAQSALKPEITNTRTRKYRIVVRQELNRVIRKWREGTRIIKNEAIRHVNMAEDHFHANLKTYRLFDELTTNTCALAKRYPFLQDVPAYAKRQVITEAVAARKALITKHFNTPAEQRGPIPIISDCTAAKDKRHGFSVALDPQSDSIDYHIGEPPKPKARRRSQASSAQTAPEASNFRGTEPADHRISPITLVIAPRILSRTEAKRQRRVQIRLSGQRQR
ncbi:hypothetical protein NDA16_003884 [Ustilago loliicola]|nr:hypothetical protein NDA16_003884 [Ustilago loliicola]